MTTREPKSKPELDKGQARHRPPLPDLLLFSATVLFGIAVRPGAISGVFALAGSLAVVGSVGLTRRHETFAEPGAIDSRLLVGAGLFGLLGVIGWAPSAIGPSNIFLERVPGAVFIGLAVLAFVMRQREIRARFLPLALATVATVALFGVSHIETAGNVGIDVYHLHVTAAEVVDHGGNPYTDDVTVPDGSPNAQPGDVISGYVYPPTVLAGYALGHWLTPDTRYTSLVSWLIVLAILGYRAVRRRSDRELHLMLLLAAIPGLWLVLRTAWTEPLSVMFAAVGVALWARREISGLGIGAMLSSKQYFLVTAPVLLLHRDKGWVRRLVSVLVVLAISFAPVLLWDLGEFWDSAVAFHTSTKPRDDGSNVVGLLASLGVDWAPSTLVPVLLGLGVAAWAAVGSATHKSFVVTMAAALAVSFLVTSQAFPNYWLLVFGLCALAMTTFETRTITPAPDKPVEDGYR